MPDILESYDPILFVTFNRQRTENRDTDFSWREFIYSHNSELLGAYGNFVNRTLKFIEKYYGGIVPKGSIEVELKDKVEGLYKRVGEAIEQTKFKVALETIFDAVRFANKYFDEKRPWKQKKMIQFHVKKRFITVCILSLILQISLNRFTIFK